MTGSLNSHDAVCRFLAVHAGVRVLAVGYRLAPEHPFPAAVDDAVAGFRFARGHAAELGADPAAIALGGDSAGANLAAVTAHLAVRAGEPVPAFLLLFYPPCDAVQPAPSRDLFAAGFLLTDADIVWFCDHYMPPRGRPRRPRASILLADDLTGMPPTYLVTAGFDPLRDEGETVRPAAGGVGRAGGAAPRARPGARIRQHDRAVRAVPGRRRRGGAGAVQRIRRRAGRAGCPR